MHTFCVHLITKDVSLSLKHCFMANKVFVMEVFAFSFGEKEFSFGDWNRQSLRCLGDSKLLSIVSALGHDRCSCINCMQPLIGYRG